jgi:hypothetical protein
LLPSKLKVISRIVVLGAGLLAASRPADSDPRPAGLVIEDSDPRLIRIQRYFRERNCPAHELAADFVLAADRHDLDWRLLPSICMIESTGGKVALNNNMFGWNSGRTRFSSLREGLYVVAERLGNARWYREKPLDRLLRTYNPVPGYPRRVIAVMRTLGPAQMTPAISH